MVYRTTYLINTYSTPPAFVVNNDKIGIHLVPNSGERTWEPKGTKHVQVLGLEDKRQMTMIVSSNVVGDLLPPQIVLTSKVVTNTRNRTTYASYLPTYTNKKNKV
jgi:hypothetical protein